MAPQEQPVGAARRPAAQSNRGATEGDAEPIDDHQQDDKLVSQT